MSADGLNSDILICGNDLTQDDLYNGGELNYIGKLLFKSNKVRVTRGSFAGLGRIVGNNATVGFCSNEAITGVSCLPVGSGKEKFHVLACFPLARVCISGDVSQPC